MPAAIESMHYVRVRTEKQKKFLHVRIWLTEARVARPYFRYPLDEELRKKLTLKCKSANDVIKLLTDLPPVAAFEVVDDDGNGVVVYNEWP